ncbi:MAG TPA: hypothetical protein VII92_09880, partial [Anaerolineae bacterium]
PHVLMYSAVTLAGLVALAVTVMTTLEGQKRSSQLALFGVRAPIGYALAGSGAATMLISAPIDDAWHQTYGVDLTIWSPPHLGGVLGGALIVLGGILTFARLRNILPKWFYWPGMTLAVAGLVRIAIFGNFPAGAFTFYNNTFGFQFPQYGLATNNPFVTAIVLSLFAGWIFIAATSLSDRRICPLLIAVTLVAVTLAVAAFADVATRSLAAQLGQRYEDPGAGYSPVQIFSFMALLTILPSMVIGVRRPDRLTKRAGVIGGLIFAAALLIEVTVILAIQGRLDALMLLVALIEMAVLGSISGWLGTAIGRTLKSLA